MAESTTVFMRGTDQIVSGHTDWDPDAYTWDGVSDTEVQKTLIAANWQTILCGWQVACTAWRKSSQGITCQPCTSCVCALHTFSMFNTLGIILVIDAAAVLTSGARNRGEVTSPEGLYSLHGIPGQGCPFAYE